MEGPVFLNLKHDTKHRSFSAKRNIVVLHQSIKTMLDRDFASSVDHKYILSFHTITILS